MRAMLTGFAAGRPCPAGDSLKSRMARIPYEDEIIISWVELHRDARYLSEVLHAKGDWKGIIAVTRGGLIPAALVARELDIRLVDTICVTSYDAGAAGVAAQVRGSVRVLKGVTGDGEGPLHGVGAYGSSLDRGRQSPLRRLRGWVDARPPFHPVRRRCYERRLL